MMIIKDFIDNDLYKLTTMYAIQQKFPKAEVIYRFVNRGKTVFPEGFANELRKEVDQMCQLTLSREAENFIRRKCYYFEPVFIDWLRGYRYHPGEVDIRQENGNLEIEIKGLWYRTVLWEVPLLAIVSELYFKITGKKADEFELRAVEKAKKFFEIQAEISEFGTRRRYSFDIQSRVIEIMKEHMGKYFNGTSNIYLAMIHDLLPIGTHPHEWFMYHGAHYGYRMANTIALENWVDVYEGDLGIALTDTYTTDNFFHSFSTKHAKLFDGVRWDSGDPKEFTDKALSYYREKRINPVGKTIVYSDSLNFEKVRDIKNYVNGRIHDVYGIGTYLSNDTGVHPLNIVIKLFAAKPVGYHNFVPAVKLSDVEGKYTGEPEEIDRCKAILKQQL